MSDPEHALLSLPADLAPTAVLDFETTGLSAASGDRVCEVAVVRVDPQRRRRPKTFSALVNPGVAMPALAESIHHITDKMVQEAPPFRAIYPRLRDMLTGAVVVAHNAPFDIGFLRAECYLEGLPLPAHGPVVCTFDLARSYFGFSQCSLEAVARRTGTRQESAHRALADARVTLQVYRALLADMRRPTSPTVGDLLATVESLQKGGPGRARIAAEVQAAAETGRPLVIDYTARNGDGPLTNRRAITVKEVKLPYIEAWCHLRSEDRVFHIRRIQRICEAS